MRDHASDHAGNHAGTANAGRMTVFVLAAMMAVLIGLVVNSPTAEAQEAPELVPLRIAKQVVGDPAPDVAFFFQDRRADATGTNQYVLNAGESTVLMVEAESFRIYELTPPPGFVFDHVTCTGGVTSPFGISPRNSQYNGRIADDAVNPTCTWVNRYVEPAPGASVPVTITKEVVGEGAPAETFRLRSSINGFLADGESLTESIAVGEVFSIEESAEDFGVLGPTWEWGEPRCEGAEPNPNDRDYGLTFVVGNVDAITCTIVNEWSPPAELTWTKHVEGPATDQLFVFSAFGLDPAFLKAGESRTIEVPPGTWNLGEVEIPTGWEFVSTICQTPLGERTFTTPRFDWDYAAGDEVQCTITNRQTYTSVLSVSTSCGINGCPAVDELALAPMAPPSAGTSSRNDAPALMAGVLVLGVAIGVGANRSRRRTRP